MGSFSGSKTKTTSGPAAYTAPYVQTSLAQTEGLYGRQQPRLEALGNIAQDAFASMAPSAFGTNPYVSNAQGAAQAISNGYFLGGNPGQGTYDRLQRSSASPWRADTPVGAAYRASANPSTMTKDRQSDSGSDILARLSAGGSNPGDRFASAVANGKYLNGQPSAGLYSNVMSQDYLTGNPYLENMIAQTNADISKNTNRMFGARGMGSGISSAFADVLSKNLANNEGQLRYQNYNDAAARQLQAAGQSDAAWNGERDRMDASTGLLSSNYNAGQDRMLAAAQTLGSQYNAAQDRYNAAQDRSLEAARASDAARSDQVAQMLQALGLTNGLASAQYAGVDPALALLNAGISTPWYGQNAMNSGVADLTGSTNSSTSVSKGPGFLREATLALIDGNKFTTSDRRLKSNIEKVDELGDGLGVYDFDYVWGGSRQRGVMADEVEALRPWALGPKTDEGYATVDYGAL